ncbi:hypothetical protein KU6B_12410 [Mameliella alba]|nr:hypothetical protein KU6B_12410 [Mameliella alba]
METRLARDLLSDEEWAFFERFIRTVRAPNGRKPTNHRLGSGLVLSQSQKITVAASAIAEKKVRGHRS